MRLTGAMIPNRIGSRENLGDGVRYRVAACRQRLRNSRAAHRIPPKSQSTELALFGSLEFDVDSTTSRRLPVVAFGKGEADKK